ncbi:MAG: HNH endonuclease [Sinobacteraceae bacterium]|nr:HNH endonuclease [Nevskiaceae bacterium]
MELKSYYRHSKSVTNTRRWRRLRLHALKRDGWQCVQCNARGRLEVDHIKAVRDAPELSYDLGNLQVLCRSCHGSKTRKEIGHKQEVSPARLKWRALVSELETKPNEQQKEITCLIV